MKVAFLLAVIVAVALAQTTPLKCYNYQCVDDGASCKATDTTFSSCKSGSFCNVDGTCQSEIGAGGDCSKNTFGCGDGLTCNGTVCGVANRMPGQTCAATSTCKAYNETTGAMIDGSCVSGRCSGIAAGANCPVNGISSCVNGYRCSNGGNTTIGAQSICVANNAVGAACTSAADCTDLRATTRLFCASSPGTCQEYFSQPAGNKCFSLIECAVGLVCNAGTCQAAVASSNKACASDAECTAPETCGCKTASSASTGQCEAPQPYTQSRADAWKSAISCAFNDFSCNAFFDAASPTASTGCSGSCYKSVCSYIFSSVDAAAEASGLDAAACVPSNLKSSFDKCRKSSASTFFVAPAVAIVALFAILF